MSVLPLLLAVVAVLGAGGVIAWVMLGRTPAPAVAPTQPQVVETTPRPLPEEATAPVSAETSPSLRELLAGLSSHASFAQWLEAKDLFRRVVAAVNQVADGESPRPSVPFLAPSSPFSTLERDGKTYVDPRSFARYDGAAAAFASIDTAKLAAAWGRFKPVLDAAYAEIGRPRTTFDQRLVQALDLLLDVPVPTAELEVYADDQLFLFTDTKLEELSAPQKHLLRMGPKNMETVQRKLRELKAALPLPTKTASRP